MNGLNEMSRVLMFNRFECTNLQFWIVGAVIILLFVALIYFIDTWYAGQKK